MTVQMIISIVLIAAGMIFMLASLTGIIRLPDFFTRLHAQGVGDTLGAFLILAGMMVWTGVCLLSVKILLIFIIILLTNPIGTNLMMIAAINREDYQGYASETGEKKAEEEKQGAEPETAEKPETEETPEQEEKKAAAERQESEGKELPSEKQESPEAPEPADKQEPEEKTGSAEKKQKKSGSKRKPRKKNRSGNIKEPDPEKTKQKDADSESKSPDKKQQKKKNPRKRKPSMNMNKAELTRIAESMNIDVPEKATKREILDLIYSK